MTIRPLTFPPLDTSRAAMAARINRGLHVIRLHALTADRAHLQQAAMELHQLSQRLLAGELADEKEAA
jgi:hypothetical protein